MVDDGEFSDSNLVIVSENLELRATSQINPFAIENTSENNPCSSTNNSASTDDSKSTPNLTIPAVSPVSSDSNLTTVQENVDDDSVLSFESVDKVDLPVEQKGFSNISNHQSKCQ